MPNMTTGQTDLSGNAILTESNFPTVASGVAPNKTFSPPLATTSTAGAMSAAQAARFKDGRTLRIVTHGDSHTEGMIPILLDPTDSTQDNRGLFGALDESWLESGGVAAIYQDNNQINVTTGSTDEQLGAARTKGSFVNRLPSLLRKAYPQLTTIRVANMGIGGASAYTWSGDMAQGYVGGAAPPIDGDWIRVGSRTYTWRNAPSAPGDLQVPAGVNEGLTYFGRGVNAHLGGIGAGTTPNPDCWVPLQESPSGGTRVDVKAKVPGAAGNSLTIQSNNSTRIYALTQGLSPTTSSVAMASGAAQSSLYANAKARLVAGPGFGTVDLYVITLGTNDGKRQVDTGNAPDYAACLTSFVSQLLADSPAAKIVLLIPMVSSISAINTYLTSVVSPAIAAIVAAYPASVASANAYGLGAGSGGTLVLSADGVHATRYGYDAIAMLVAKAAASLLGL